MTMHIGLIGLGRIGAFHAETLSTLPAVDSLVVTDAVPSLTQQVAERFGAHAVDSPDALLADGVDGVVIAAPGARRAGGGGGVVPPPPPARPPPLLGAGGGGGPRVLCERPVAGRPGAAVAFLKPRGDGGVRVQIGSPRRFDAGFAAARAA